MTSAAYILVAEDDLDATFLLQHAFAQVAPGLHVVYTSDGKEAIDILQGKHTTESEHHHLPSLLLLDLNMPRMDGFEVLAWLQRFPALRPDCIVVLSTSPSQVDINRTQELGADYYVVKPMAVAELVDIVRGLAAFCQTGHWPLPWAQGRPQVFPLRAH